MSGTAAASLKATAALLACGLTAWAVPLSPAGAQEPDSATAPFSVTAAAPTDGAIHALIVAGLGGTGEYRERFNGWALELHGALVERHGLTDAQVTYLGERTELAPDVMDGRATRENVLAALDELAASTGPGDRVLVVFIGHGTAQRDEVRFNLPGPDLSPEELAGGLSGFTSQALALVHTGSASGGFLASLSGPGRVVVTATSSARERNATEFPRFFVEAVAGEAADLDKDGRTSLLEAFSYARLETERHYDEENELLTEHAVLDDDGDGEGTREASAEGPDGRMAATFHLGAPASATTAPEETDDPVLARLYRERTGIQERIDSLRGVRDTLEESEYESRLEDLLVELALKNREIRAREGGGA